MDAIDLFVTPAPRGDLRENCFPFTWREASREKLPRAGMAESSSVSTSTDGAAESASHGDGAAAASPAGVRGRTARMGFATPASSSESNGAAAAAALLSEPGAGVGESRVGVEGVVSRVSGVGVESLISLKSLKRAATLELAATKQFTLLPSLI